MREDLALPLKVDDNSSGWTRNLSASGLYLEIVGMYRPEGPVVFELETGRLKFMAQGEVVRLDQARSKTGVAVKFAVDKLKAID